MYKGLFDASGTFVAANLKEVNKARAVQTGYFDKYILCSNCDNAILGKLEKYVSVILNGGSLKNVPAFALQTVRQDLDIMTSHDLSYKDYKLFILSILWRAHVSKNKFFKNIWIPDLEPVIKEMILKQEPGKEDVFKVSVMAIRGANGQLPEFISEPGITKTNDIRFAFFVIGGFIYIIELNCKSGLTFLEHYYLKETGEINIPILSGELGERMLAAMGIPKDFRLTVLYS